MNSPLVDHIMSAHLDHPEANGMTDNLRGYVHATQARWHSLRFPKCQFQNNAGSSILEHLWQELDTVVLGIAQLEEAHPLQGRSAGDWVAISSLKGEALGLARAIAIMRNPYAPDVDAVRAEAMERLDAR